MGLKHTIVKFVSVESLCREMDDALDCKTVTRAEAMQFLQAMLLQIELRIGWVRDALREERLRHEL
jgi:hypothetical protein